jgi:hypothetical protein
MTIVTEQVHAGLWTAIDSGAYEGTPDMRGPGSFIGTGATEAEALANLRDQLLDYYAGLLT